MIASAFMFALMGAAVKVAAQTLPNAMVVFFRNAVSLVWLLPWMLRQGRGALRTQHLQEHVIRGLGGLAAMYCFFFALAHLRLADAVLLNYTLPLLLPFVERSWLGEPLPRGLLPVLGIGFAGVMLILRPGTSLFTPAALVGLAAAGFAALAQVGVRRLTQSEPTGRIVTYFALIASACSAPPAALAWVAPGGHAWLALVLAGSAATAGQVLLTRAYACAPAARVGPFLYTGVLFSALLDVALWQIWPDGWFVGGALLVSIAAVLALRLRDTRRQPSSVSIAPS